MLNTYCLNILFHQSSTFIFFIKSLSSERFDLTWVQYCSCIRKNEARAFHFHFNFIMYEYGYGYGRAQHHCVWIRYGAHAPLADWDI